MSVNIYVGNLPYTMDEGALRSLFEEHGQVSSAKVVIDHATGKSKGFGFVEMPGKDEAENAIEALNGFMVQGRPLKVNEARPRTDNNRPMNRNP